jgi:hypothetical protein
LSLLVHNWAFVSFTLDSLPPSCGDQGRDLHDFNEPGFWFTTGRFRDAGASINQVAMVRVFWSRLSGVISTAAGGFMTGDSTLLRSTGRCVSRGLLLRRPGQIAGLYDAAKSVTPSDQVAVSDSSLSTWSGCYYTSSSG